MFIYRPVDVTSHLIVSISVSRWSKYCVPCNNTFHVLFCQRAHSAFAINLLLHDVHLMIMFIECFILGPVQLNSQFLPSVLNYISTIEIFLYLLLPIQVPSRIVHVLVSSLYLLSSRFHCLTSVDSCCFGQQFLVSYIFDLLVCFFFKDYLVFPASYTCTNLVKLSLPSLRYSTNQQ